MRIEQIFKPVNETREVYGSTTQVGVEWMVAEKTHGLILKWVLRRSNQARKSKSLFVVKNEELITIPEKIRILAASVRVIYDGVEGHYFRSNLS